MYLWYVFELSYLLQQRQKLGIIITSLKNLNWPRLHAENIYMCELQKNIPLINVIHV